MNKTLKIIAIIVILGGGSYLAYSHIVLPNLDTANSDQNTNTTYSTEAINQKFVQSLAGISTITLDKSIFSNPAFSSLVDYSNPLTPEPNIGRGNPFLPIGSEDMTAINADAVSTSTIKVKQ